MPIIDDEVLGRVTIRRTTGTSMRASLAPNGTLRVSVPNYTPMFVIKRMISGAREDLKNVMAAAPKLELSDGMPVGKSHTLHVRKGSALAVRRTRLQIAVTLGPSDTLSDAHVSNLARKEILLALRREAKAHLPKRIEFLAKTHGFSYTSLRFTHASSRWGSCNNLKAISLNIALMNLPFELIDYVLIHELAHTVELNHSKEFWHTVAAADPGYMTHRKELKKYNPSV